MEELMGAADPMETTQYLTFKLDEELFALDISKAREVLDLTSITRVPRMPEYMLGVINLRGTVVPVVDLRIKFGMTRSEKTVNTCIIITEVMVDEETLILGALVDSVQEVIDLEPGDLEPPPKIGARLNTDFIKGMGKQNNKFIIILYIDKIFSTSELAMVQHTGKETTAEAGFTDAAAEKNGLDLTTPG
jgi:purine-binding chemotaxis protein CheW